VDVGKFEEVVNRLQLLQSAHQLDEAITNYASLANRYT
jgi:hypothetical protein